MRKKRTLYHFVLVILTISLVLGVSLLFAGAKEKEAVEEKAVAPEVVEWKEKEAPMVYEMVKAGKLPSLEKRLPKNPRVIDPFEETGKYGGTFVRGTGFLMPDEWLVSHIDINSFFAFQWPFPGEGPVVPNLAESWEFNNDGTELTIHLREGIKWSDGKPFTADDVLFFLNDVIADKNVVYTWYHTSNLYVGEGVLPEVEKIDNYTIKFTYPYPNFFVETGYSCLCEVALPKHHLSQFHPRYNADATYEDFNKNLVWVNGRGKVTLNAWMLEEFVPDKKVSMVRNPYYWKVDKEGNQLPYFDRVEVYVAGDRQGVALGNVTGKYDNDAMWVGIQHLSLFLEEEPKRDYTIGHSIVSGMGIWFNYDCPDKDARTVTRNTDFRRACSLAVNRPEIGRVMFYDTLVPMGCSFSPNSAYFEEAVGKLYSEYDPEKAKEILNAAGITDRNGDGIRELPTGEKCELVWDVYEHDLYTPISEMVVEYLADVGIRFVLNVQHQNLVTERREAGEYEVSTYDFMNVDEPLAGLEWWTPVTPGTPFWHKKASEAPFSRRYARFIDLMQGAKALPFDERVKALKEANKIMAEDVFALHIGFYKRPNITSNRVGNLPHKATRIDEFGCDAPPFMYYQVYEKYPRGE